MSFPEVFQSRADEFVQSIFETLFFVTVIGKDLENIVNIKFFNSNPCKEALTVFAMRSLALSGKKHGFSLFVEYSMLNNVVDSMHPHSSFCFPQVFSNMEIFYADAHHAASDVMVSWDGDSV